MGLTTTRALMVAALSGAVVAYAALSLAEFAGSFAPLVPYTVPVTVALLGIAAWWYARVIARRIEQQRTTPSEALRAVVMGKSMLFTGAILAGGHVVYVISDLDALDAPLPLQRVTVGLVTIVASLLLAWGGSRIERACFIGPDEPTDADEPPDSAT